MHFYHVNRFVPHMEGGFVLDRWHVLTGAVDASMVVPVHPFERRTLDVVERAAGSFAVDDLGLVESVDGFRECVIVGFIRLMDISSAFGSQFRVSATV